MKRSPKQPLITATAIAVAAVALLLSCSKDDRSSILSIGDSTAPNAITDLAVTAPECGIVQLTWTATGNDGISGLAAKYDVRYSRSKITNDNFYAAKQLQGVPSPSEPGTLEHFTAGGFEPAKEYYFAIKAIDDAGNASLISKNAYKEITAFQTGKILLIDCSDYLPMPGSISAFCDWEETFGGINPSPETFDPYFVGLLTQAGYAPDSIFYGNSNTLPSIPTSEELMSRYNLVILINESYYTAQLPTKAWLEQLKFYLDQGGKVMVFGRNTFFDEYGGDFPLPEYRVGSIPRSYFGVRVQHYHEWMSSWFSYEMLCEIDHSNEEMIGASASIPSLADIDASWSNLEDYMPIDDIPRTCSGSSVNHWRLCESANADYTPYPFRGIPGVNYYDITDDAEALYLAESADGSTGFLSGKIVGCRYQTDCFKTAAFSFPIYAIEEADAVALLKNMIDWFEVD